MPGEPNADIDQDAAGRTVLRFERLLVHPPERVWSALTELDELRAWHPSPFELEGRSGSVVRYLPPDGVAFGDGEVTAFEPPRLLAYSWGDDLLRWELQPREQGTLLVLTHTFDDRLKAARDATGWQLSIDALAVSLVGDHVPAPVAEAAIPAGWEGLNAAYEQRFRIRPEHATPPPISIGPNGSLVPQLMFTGQAEEAMRYYLSCFYPARIVKVIRYGPGEEGAEGTVRHAILQIARQTLTLVDSPPVHTFGFTPAVSLVVECDTTDAVDRLFARLSHDGTVLMPLGAYPFSDRFAWVNDRYGVSWQLSHTRT